MSFGVVVLFMLPALMRWGEVVLLGLFSLPL
jgi:hypothetical protein